MPGPCTPAELPVGAKVKLCRFGYGEGGVKHDPKKDGDSGIVEEWANQNKYIKVRMSNGNLLTVRDKGGPFKESGGQIRSFFQLLEKREAQSDQGGGGDTIIHGEAPALGGATLREKNTTKMGYSALRDQERNFADGANLDSAIRGVVFKARSSGAPLGIQAAKDVWSSAIGDCGVTKSAKDTMAAVLDEYKFDTLGKLFLQQKLEWLSIASRAVQVADPGNRAADMRPRTVLLSRVDAMALKDLPSPIASPAPAIAAAETVKPETVQASAEPPTKKRKRFDTSKIRLEQLRQIFDECDSNDDGKVTKIELIKACRRDSRISDFLGLPTRIRQEDGSRSQMEELFQAIDKNSDREICWIELLAYYKHLVVDLCA